MQWAHNVSLQTDVPLNEALRMQKMPFHLPDITVTERDSLAV
jgi:hypothetical protein